MLDKEQRIKEQRTIEATKKGYMGLSGKLACIMRNLGQPILSETSDFYSTTSLSDVWDLDDKYFYDATKIHDADEDISIREIGFMFDGLNRGMHLEIKYLTDEKTLTVNYKGYKVYREQSGDLEAFSPDPEWEDLVSKLFLTAKKISEERKKEHNIVSQEKAEKKVKNIIEQLRLRWGL